MEVLRLGTSGWSEINSWTLLAVKRLHTKKKCFKDKKTENLRISHAGSKRKDPRSHFQLLLQENQNVTLNFKVMDIVKKLCSKRRLYSKNHSKCHFSLKIGAAGKLGNCSKGFIKLILMFFQSLK